MLEKNQMRARAFMKKANNIVYIAIDNLYIYNKISYIVVRDQDLLNRYEELKDKTLWFDITYVWDRADQIKLASIEMGA